MSQRAALADFHPGSPVFRTTVLRAHPLRQSRQLRHWADTGPEHKPRISGFDDQSVNSRFGPVQIAPTCDNRDNCDTA